MNEKKMEGCCGHTGKCVQANHVDTDNCPEQNDQGQCCNDTAKCVDALAISGEHCPEKSS